MSEFPRKDVNHFATYWTGPVSQPGTHVTGWKKRDGARATYYKVTCTCEPYTGIGDEITGYSFDEVRDELDRRASEHAAEHVATEAEAAHDMPLTDECGECGAELEFEQAAGWVDAVSGDDGGTYDYCPERRFAGHLPKRHELTCPAGTPGPGALPHG